MWYHRGMVLASHVIFCAYGFWLPNDPRGSWSDFVGAWELRRFGRATNINTRRSVAGMRHDGEKRRLAKTALKYPAVSFTGVQARAVGRGFAEYIHRSNVSVLACSILPRHVHMVIGRHEFNVEYVVNQLKGYATRRLSAEQIHPFADVTGPARSCWARGQWKVFLDSPADVQRATDYVRANPSKEGLPMQSHGFSSDTSERFCAKASM
jgi:REP element-mobilizing transposase RayT